VRTEVNVITVMAKTLDELLSDAQLLLRDGHNDHLSRAVADARNRLRELEREVARLKETKK
jgi:hypothetical protein